MLNHVSKFGVFSFVINKVMRNYVFQPRFHGEFHGSEFNPPRRLSKWQSWHQNFSCLVGPNEHFYTRCLLSARTSHGTLFYDICSQTNSCMQACLCFEISVCPWPDLSSLFQYTSPTPVVSLHSKDPVPSRYPSYPAHTV